MEALAAEEAARQAEQEAINEARRTGEFDRYIRRIQVAIETVCDAIGMDANAAEIGVECAFHPGLEARIERLTTAPRGVNGAFGLGIDSRSVVLRVASR